MRISLGPLVAAAFIILAPHAAQGGTLGATFQSHLDELKRPKAGWSLWHLYEAHRHRHSVQQGGDRLNQAAERLVLSPALPPLLRGELLSLLGSRSPSKADGERLASAGHPTHIAFLGPLKGHGFERSVASTWTDKKENGVFGLTSWRSLESPRLNSALRNGDLIHCSGDCHGVVEAWLETSRDSTATLVLSSNGPIRVWLDNALVHEWDGERRYRPWQHAIKVKLGRGNHRLTVHYGHREATPQLSMRILDTADGTLKFSRYIERPQSPIMGTFDPASAQTAGPMRRFSRFKGLTPRLALHFASGKEALLHASEAFRADLNNKPADAAIWALLARCHPTSPNRARAAWAKAAQLSGGAHADALAALYRLDEENKRHEGALERCRELLEADPKHPTAIECDLRWFDEGLSVESSQVRLNQARRQIKPPLRVDLLAVDYFQRTDQHIRTAHLAREISAKLGGHLGLLRRASRIYSRANMRTKALASVREFLLMRPYSVEAHILHAELLAGQARDAESASQRVELGSALAALEGGIVLQPFAPELYEARGRLLLEGSKRARGLDDLDRALSMRPQNQELATWRRTLAGQDSLASTHAIPLETLLARAEGIPPAQEGARILFDKRVIQVHSNALSTRWRQRVVRLDANHGAKQFATIRLPYTPGVERLQVLQAEVRRRDGSTVRPDGISDERPPGKQQGIYTLTAFRVVRFPKLEPGDVLHIQTQLSPLADNNLFGPHFGAFIPTQDQWPIAEAMLMVTVPEGMTLKHERKGVGQWRHMGSNADGNDRRMTYTWVGRDVAALKYEPLMPGYSDVGGTLSISSIQSWDTLVAWYQGFIRDQLNLSPKLRATAIALARKHTSLRDKVAAIHRWVVDNTRYVGIEFGIHGFKPYSMDDIVRRGYGDCKDKAALFAAMLNEAGIPSEFVLIRTRDRGAVSDTVPSLWVFNHAIAYVPGLDTYVDATSELAALGEVPRADQGGTLLRFPILGKVTPKGTLTTLPFTPAEENTHLSTATIELSVDGSANARFTETITGTQAASMRSMFENRSEQKNRLERVLSQNYAGASLTHFQVRGLEPTIQGVTLQLGAHIPGFARRGDGTLSIPVHADPGGLLDRYGPLGKREHPLYLPLLSRERTRTTLNLPEGSRITMAPSPALQSNAFADYSLRVNQDGNRVVIEEDLVFKRDSIATADYAEFRRFLSSVSQYRRARLTLTLATAAD